MSKTQSSFRFRLLRAGIATGAVTAAVIAATAVPAFAVSVPMTLSSPAGPSGGGNSITGTATPTATVPTPFPAGVTPVVEFQYIGASTAATCSALYKAPVQMTAGATTPFAPTAGVVQVDPTTVKRVSATKIAFTVPSAPAGYSDAPLTTTPSTANTNGLALMGGQTSAKWNVCVYDGTDPAASTLLATSTYTIATRPKITGITPGSSPALGGQLITINGSGFASTGTTATVGGAALTNVKVASNGNSLTGNTPAHAAGTGFAVVVTTAGGSVTSTDPDNNGLPDDGNPATTVDNPITFDYSNSISVIPNTAPANQKVDLDIQGVGFQQLVFNAVSATAPTAQVFLVQGAYVAASNRGVKRCTGILVVSDTEIICTLDLTTDRLVAADSTVDTGNKVAEGAYTVTVVANGDPAEADLAVIAASNVNSGATFTVAPY
ncbi:IPT/TIG domain-containing protein [Actinoplanes sp. NPDC049599]|uniref:IPT/TIG domain-containing protein n=1 Tax=Actinoplanes sp. NPDC049599 TaxID=3363903 RepID=UPI0037970D97